MKERIVRTKELYTAFEHKFIAFCNEMDSANLAISRYLTAAAKYKKDYSDDLGKASVKLRELEQEEAKKQEEKKKLRDEWSHAALNDLDVDGIEARIDSVLTDERIIKLKKQAIEEQKLTGDMNQTKALEDMSEEVSRMKEKALSAKNEATAAALALLENLGKSYGAYDLRTDFTVIGHENELEYLVGLRSSNIRDALARERKNMAQEATIKKQLMEQARRFAEEERQVRINRRENELIQNRKGDMVTIEGKAFKLITYPMGKKEYRCDGLLLRDYLEKTMPLTEADYKAGGFRPDGERY